MSPWILAFRPKTLPASVSPILLGSALAFNHASFNTLLFIASIACAMFLQIAVNLANDYFDAQTGIDTEERIGPVRATQAKLISHRSMLHATILFSFFALLAGLFLIWQSHSLLLILGALSILAVFAYSGGPWPLASNGLGEFTVFIFFGWLAVAGTYFVQTQTFSLTALAYGSAAGFLSAAIMLVNNIRDINTDQQAGKNTLAVKLGDVKSRRLYVAFLILTLLSHTSASAPFNDDLLSFAPPFICLVPAFFLSHRVIKQPVVTFNSLLAQTALLLLLYCVTTSLLLL